MQLRGTRYIFFAALFLGGLWCAKVMPIHGRQIIAMTVDDTGKTLIIKKGQVFMLTLSDHVDGGYRFDTIQYNPAVIFLQKHTDHPPMPNSLRGRSGTGAWQFVGRAAGQTTVKITATRPWKGGGTVTIFENKVTVK